MFTRLLKNSCLLNVKNVKRFSNSAQLQIWSEKLADAVTPLWRIPYSEQLAIKDERNLSIIRKLTKKLKKDSKNPTGLVCQLLDTVPSPAIENYRNKDEFHVRYDANGEIAVGLCIGKGSDHSLVCISSADLRNTRPVHSDLAEHFRDYVVKSSWKLCEHFQKGGNWRNFTVRSNWKNDLMAIVTIHPQNLEPQEIQEEMERMKEHLVSRADGNLKSLYYQSCPHTRCTSEQSPFHLLHGQPHIYERIGDYNFRISPESFFQVNTEAATVLYDTVSKLLNVSKMTTVMDICCGTGTQGLMVARKVRGVIGIELSRSAVEDARFNAQLNEIHNSEFYVGRVEKLFQPVIEELHLVTEISAIVNPSRAGVHSRLIRLIRENDRIRNLVYVSCQPDGPAMKNFVDLVKKDAKSEAFSLKKAVPVDMFPHTDHCEMVLLFQR